MRADQNQDRFYAPMGLLNELKLYSQYCNHLQHQGGLFDDLLLAQSGKFSLKSDGDRPESVGQIEWDKRIDFSKLTFRGSYRMTPDEALKICKILTLNCD